MRRALQLKSVQVGLRSAGGSPAVAVPSTTAIARTVVWPRHNSFAAHLGVPGVPRRYNHAPATIGAADNSPFQVKDVDTFRSVEIREGHILLTPSPNNPSALPKKFQTLWLRDSCNCPQCVDPHSGQKTFATTDLIEPPSLENVELDTHGNLTLHWAGDKLSKDSDGRHTTVYSSWDLAMATGANGQPRIQLQPPVERTLWDKEKIQSMIEDGSCRVDYTAWMRDEDAFWHAFETLCKTGLIFVTGVPEDENSVKHIANRIGELQYTFYGWTWDVKSKPQAENVAYTNQFLGLHQDLMYHNPVPRLQLLHCITNECEGGESLFSDGMHAVANLQANDPDAYGLLRQHPVWYGYEKGGHHYTASRAVINAPGDYPASIHWAPPFQTTFKHQRSDLPRWIRCAKAFQDLIEAPDKMLEVKMSAGECAIFDNHRVLHGRKEFAVGGEKTRWLKGTYISHQVFRAKETQLQRRLTGEGKIWPADKRALRSALWDREQAAAAKSPGEKIPRKTAANNPKNAEWDPRIAEWNALKQSALKEEIKELQRRLFKLQKTAQNKYPNKNKGKRSEEVGQVGNSADAVKVEGV